MNLKKIISFILIMIVTGGLISCGQTKIYYQNDSSEFIKTIVDFELGNQEQGLYLDLRLTIDYETEHLQNARCLDLSLYDQESFLTWLKPLVTKKTTLIVYDQGDQNYLKLIEWLPSKLVKKVYIYTEGYQTLRLDPLFDQLLYVATGPDDCGC